MGCAYHSIHRVGVLIAGGIAIWFMVSTGREVVALHDELIWPEKIVRGDSDHDPSV
jgi:hypothetical protein